MSELRVATLDGDFLQFNEYGSVRIRVNARPAPRSFDFEARAGMISLYLVSPGISGLLYSLMRLTSHFGCGHVEFAFYETHDKVTFFAVRNIVRSNLDRLQLNKHFRSLKLSRSDDEIVLLKLLLNKLNTLGIETSFASPDECVALAVTPSLLVPKQRIETIEALRRKYQRIEKKLAADCDVTHASKKEFGEQPNKSMHNKRPEHCTQ